jgi:hypothetical protein
MTAIRSVIHDLIERRLWPVAVLLVILAIAIPVLLLKPAADVPAPALAANPAPALGSSPAVSVSQGGGGPVLGGVKNPFRQQYLPVKPKTASTSSPSTAASSGGTTPTGGSSPGGSTPGSGSTPSGSGGSKPAAAGATLEVRFGLADGKRSTYKIAPGGPLPSATNPLLVYLGQDKGGKVASFLVSSDAQPQGDGRCEPDKSICSTLYMKAGDTEFFDVTGPGGTVQYELEVLKVLSG